MSSPSLIRDSRIKHLVFIAKAILEGGASQHLLIDKLERASFLLWPTLRDKTRKEYAVCALKIVLSKPPFEFDLLTEGVPPREVT